MRNVTILLAVVAMLAVVAQAASTPTVYEPYNYATPGNVAGKSGGGDIGFSAVWQIGTGMTTHALTTGSPVYPAGSPLTSVGNSADIRWGNGDMRSLSNAIGLNADNTFYMSALVEIHATVTYVPNVDLGLGPATMYLPNGVFFSFSISSTALGMTVPRNFLHSGARRKRQSYWGRCSTQCSNLSPRCEGRCRRIGQRHGLPEDLQGRDRYGRGRGRLGPDLHVRRG